MTEAGRRGESAKKVGEVGKAARTAAIGGGAGGFTAQPDRRGEAELGRAPDLDMMQSSTQSQLYAKEVSHRSN